MAIVATAAVVQQNYKSWTITALDADTGPINIAHNMTAAPDLAFFQELSSTQANSVDAHWQVTTTSTNVVLSKLSATGSGGTTPGTTIVGKVWALLPNSIMQ